MSLAELSVTLNTVSEIFTLPPQQRLKESDRQGSEPVSGGFENMTGRSLGFSHQHLSVAWMQSVIAAVSEQDHLLLLPQWVEGRTLGKHHSSSYAPIFQLRLIFPCAARAWPNSWKGCRQLAAALGGRSFKTNPELTVPIRHQQDGTFLNRGDGWGLVQTGLIPSAEDIRFPLLCWKLPLAGRGVEAWAVLLLCHCDVTAWCDVMVLWRMRTG